MLCKLLLGDSARLRTRTRGGGPGSCSHASDARVVVLCGLRNLSVFVSQPMRRAAPPAPRVSVAPRVVARHVSARATQHTFPLPMRTPLCRPPPSLHFACRFSTASPPSNPTPQPAQAPTASAQSAPASKGDITPERWTEKNEAVFREIADLLHDNKHFQVRRFRV